MEVGLLRMTHLTKAVVRFAAGDVLELIRQASEQRRDEVWLMRCDRCYLKTPDCEYEVDACLVTGDAEVIFDDGFRPRVEILELHNHVLRVLSKATESVEGWFVEVHFNEVGDFCLFLCDRTEELEPRPMSWMSSMNDRRLF
jgi:hypothetical protein